MIKAMVSVIVPIYNAEKYLVNTLSDILKQTYKNLDIVLIDDGSTDSSHDIIQKYAQYDQRIRVIQVNNGGPSNARNIGIEKAKGEYIRFLDADDRIPENSIEEMMKVYQENQNIDIIIGNYKSIPEKNLITGKKIKEGLVSDDEFIHIFMENIRSFYIGVPWNKLYKRKIIEQYNIRFDKDVVWCEDFLFNIEYYDKCRLFYLLYLDAGVYEYYLRDTSITHVIKKKGDKQIIEEIEELRYRKAKEYCEKYGKTYIFEQEWNCSNVYAQLSALTKKDNNMSITERYKEFIGILKKPQIYDYICMKSNSTEIRMWKILEYLIRKKKYTFTFVFFWTKGFMVTNMGGITNFIKKKVNHYVPPNL